MRVLGCAILLAAACAPARQPAAPAAASVAADPARQAADAECRDRAARETETVTPQGQASKAAIGIYVKCMSEKGFAPPAR
ncbi:MAG: hypothetical protein AB1689_28815 [Thermodesulfobacteriota bacterium]